MKDELPAAVAISERLPDDKLECILPASVDGVAFVPPVFTVKEFLDGNGYATGKLNAKGRPVTAKAFTGIIRRKINTHYEGLSSKQRDAIFNKACGDLRMVVLGAAAVIEAKVIEEGWEKQPVGFNKSGSGFTPYRYVKPKADKALDMQKKLEQQVGEIRREMFVALLNKGFTPEEAQSSSKVSNAVVAQVMKARAIGATPTESAPETAPETPETAPAAPEAPATET